MNLKFVWKMSNCMMCAVCVYRKPQRKRTELYKSLALHKSSYMPHKNIYREIFSFTHINLCGPNCHVRVWCVFFNSKNINSIWYSTQQTYRHYQHLYVQQQQLPALLIDLGVWVCAYVYCSAIINQTILISCCFFPWLQMESFDMFCCNRSPHTQWL